MHVVIALCMGREGGLGGGGGGQQLLAADASSSLPIQTATMFTEHPDAAGRNCPVVWLSVHKSNTLGLSPPAAVM